MNEAGRQSAEEQVGGWTSRPAEAKEAVSDM